MYSFYKSIITHAHQQVIFSYEALLYTKEEEKWGTNWDLFLKKIGYRRYIRSYILLFNCFPIKCLGWYKPGTVIACYRTRGSLYFLPLYAHNEATGI